MTDAAIDIVLDQIAEARGGYSEWSEIAMKDLVAALEDEGLELTRPEFDTIINMNPDFYLGRDRYDLAWRDNGVATYRCGDWSALTFKHDEEDQIVWVSESHPY